MLVENKKFNKGDIVVLKLANSEEVCGYFVEKTESEYRIIYPYLLIPDRNDRVVMHPWTYSRNDDDATPIGIFSSQVVAIYEMKEGYKPGYIQRRKLDVRIA